MSDEENTPEPSEQEGSYAVEEQSPEEILDGAVKLATVAMEVAQEALTKVEEAAELSDFSEDEIESARQQANAALEGAQEALEKAQNKAGGQERHKPTIDELAKSAGEIHDRLERRRLYDQQKQEKEEEDARRKQELAEAEEKRKIKAAQKAEEEQEKKEKEEREAAEAKVEAEAQKKLEEERRKKASTPEGRAELAKQRKIEVRAINNEKQDLLETVKAGLKPRYSELQGSLTTLFMLPHIRPLHIERNSDQDEPKLMCYYGSLDKTKNGYQTDKFRAVITSAPDGLYNLEHQAWKSYTDGREKLTSFTWGTDMYGPVPNPRENITFEEVIDTMHQRLDDIEQLHKDMGLGRMIRVGLITAALATAAAYHEELGAETLEELLEPTDGSTLVITQPTRRLLPEGFVYNLDGYELEGQEVVEEPSF